MYSQEIKIIMEPSENSALRTMTLQVTSSWCEKVWSLVSTRIIEQ